MTARVLCIVGVSIGLALCGCKPSEGPAPAPVTPAFPKPAQVDPQKAFDQWKALVTDPEAAKTGSVHIQLAADLKERAPELVPQMVDLMLDPATTPESRFLIMNSLEVAQTPELYPRLLDLTKPEVDPSIRTGVVIMLKNATEPSVVARIRELVNDPERRVKLAAMMVLSETGDKPARAVLQEYYFTEGLPAEHRARIVQSLALTPEAGDLKVLTTAVTDATLGEEARLVATGAIGRVGDSAGLPALDQVAQGNDSAELKKWAASAAKVIRDKAASSSAPTPPGAR
ncbi:MAG: HEAT repeat domain-containing protein [Candidatus Hydrogenedentes bacterium]|nr:HEAT repeat domain-containing protein [Candidatus Hydrogenedentota bacterium]